ncbi:AAA domain-containing protein [Haloplasma contractile]|uniref:Superfamily I DNA protein n=1 Tax=Haloplasma contractile SSD-17B TaxID=1033810 RepID=F7PWP2_9MOLU|nr:AAA domain-containing protein [Haloplasma contractile]ERJ12585.1 superfamily I DNA protein [Haloplasma contractile SSD-17B]
MDQTKFVLENYKKRLLNVNSRLRTLFLGRTSRRRAIDLFTEISNFYTDTSLDDFIKEHDKIKLELNYIDLDDIKDLVRNGLISETLDMIPELDTDDERRIDLLCKIGNITAELKKNEPFTNNSIDDGINIEKHPYLKKLNPFIHFITKSFGLSLNVLNHLFSGLKDDVNQGDFIWESKYKELMSEELLTNLEYILSNTMLIKNFSDIHELLFSLVEKYNNQREKSYRNFLLIRQEQRAIIRESGKNELFFGFPFVEGKIGDKDSVRAPLIMTPVEIVETKKHTLEIHLKREDAIINPMIIMLYIAYHDLNLNGFNFELSTKTMSGQIIECDRLLNNLGLALKLDQEMKLEPCLPISKVEFDQTVSNNNYKVKGYPILAIFPITNLHIYNDYQNIITNLSVDEEGLLHKMLLGDGVNLFTGSNNYDLISGYKEDDILKINDLDFTQSIVVRNSLDKNLVIQGPPGTGKSQVISNIIANAINQNKSVLVVSEKRAAIDVIINRLGTLSPMAMLVSDLADKRGFFNQILNTFAFLKTLYNNHNKTHLYHNYYGNRSSNGENNTGYYGNSSLEQVNNTILDFFNKEKELLAFDNGVGKFYQFLLRSIKDYSNAELMKKDGKVLLSRYIEANTCNSSDNLNYNEELYHLITKSLSTLYDEMNDYELQYMELHRTPYLYKFYKEYLKYDDNYKNLKKLLTLLKSSDYTKEQKHYIFENAYYRNKVQKLNFITRKYTSHIYKSKLSEEEELYLNDLLNYNQEINVEKINTDLLYNKSDLERLINYIIENKVSYKVLMFTFETIFSEKFRQQFSSIFDFINTHDQMVNNVEQSFNEKTTHSINIIINSYYERIKQVNTEFDKEILKLNHEANLKRHKQIRVMFNRHFELLKQIYPVMLMTPDVVSSVLPIKENQFDLVIFDEASQLFVEKSIPSIYRAKSMIVAGDEHQLKPFHSFSKRYIDFDEDDDEYIEAEENLIAESLLDASKGKYRNIMLDSHYRSLYKELIDYSSHAYYNGKLKFASMNKQLELPIELIQTTGTWANQQNKEEALEVVALVESVLIKRKYNESIGIITFNKKQKDLIEELIIEKSSDNPVLKDELDRRNEEDERDESLFVKNIENVQGDERDIIVFSIGYAKNKKGKMVNQFGSLSQAGGENRLNVAITRAKRKIYVVKSCMASDFNINEDNRGPYLFKKYVKYVECLNTSGEQDEQIMTLLNSLSSDEEQTIKDTRVTDVNYSALKNDIINSLSSAINKDRYKVIPNLRVGSFRVDIGIYDTYENVYKLVIECNEIEPNQDLKIVEYDYDSYKYLQQREWNIYRLWNYNWLLNKEKEVGIIIKLLK